MHNRNPGNLKGLKVSEPTLNFPVAPFASRIPLSVALTSTTSTSSRTAVLVIPHDRDGLPEPAAFSKFALESWPVLHLIRK